MTRHRLFILAAVASAALLWTHACDGTPPPPPDPPRATTVTVTPLTAGLAALEATVQLTAEVRDQYGDVMANASVSWSSSDVSVATVDGSGLVTAAANGAATITATSGQASGAASVEVAQVVTEVAVTPEADTLVEADTLRFSAHASDANGHAVEAAEFAWSSGDTLVAVVDDSGLATGVAPGAAQVTATSSGVSAAAALTVAAAVPTTLAVTPDTVAFTAIGQTVQLAAEVRDQIGRVMEGEAVAWSSGDTAVAVVDATGVVTAGRRGTVAITATAGQVVGTATVTITQVAGSVVVSPPADTIEIGDTLRLLAEALDGNGHPIAGASFEWSSSDAVVAVVGVGGMVRGAGEGAATITATAGDATGTSEITVENPDRAALQALYHATGGPNWNDNRNWLSDRQLREWAGVETNAAGRVIELKLRWNGLAGKLPPELGRLTYLGYLDLRDGRLTGGIPPELGQLEYLKDMLFARNQLTGGIPPELGNLGILTALDFSGNQLSGGIPPELGNLIDLEYMHLGENQLSGEIPPELGNLEKLTELFLSWNWRVTGEIPSELGRLENLRILSLGTLQVTRGIPPEFGDLANLEELWIFDTKLTGTIPPELGDLVNLRRLMLYDNDLTGNIPREIGDLESLEVIWLEHNDLTGRIPPEIGRLDNLVHLRLHNNHLHGELPPELGNLGNLERLVLHDNQFSGPVPPEFGDMSRLQQLWLENNEAMSGPLPRHMTELTELQELLAGNTGLCAPSEAVFQDWLSNISRGQVAICDRPEAYLTQAVQSRFYPVTLVAGEEALLRVFPTARESNDQDIPGALVRFYVDGDEIHSRELAGKPGPIPTHVTEGDLSKSLNAGIEAEVIREGLEMVIEVDSVDAGLGVPRRIPETGRLPVTVREMPPLDLTVIPYIWTENPDSQIVDLVAELADDPMGHELLWETRTLLPVRDLLVTAHNPVETDTEDPLLLLQRTRAIRILEQGTGHYKGTIGGQFSEGTAGIAYRPGRSSFSRPISWVMAHELGHNMSARHAPCGGPQGVDRAYPEKDGSIGGWGWDFRDGGRLVRPSAKALMSYCGPRWISYYYFSKTAGFRVSEADSVGLPRRAGPEESLLLWGGVGEDGTPFLDPAFVVEAPPELPTPGGEYLLTGRDAGATDLFSLSFDMPEVAHGDGRSAFVFVLPTRPGWLDALDSITLSGPGGAVTLDGGSDNPLAIVRDRVTGVVRGFVRAAPTDPPPSVEVLFSRGIPR